MYFKWKSEKNCVIPKIMNGYSSMATLPLSASPTTHRANSATSYSLICQKSTTKSKLELLDSPEKINEAPYDAWFIKVSDFEEADDLMSADEYKTYLEGLE